MIEIYNKIKENRSLLRSQARRAIDQKEYFKTKEYNNLLIKLGKIQLDLEVNKKKLKMGFEYLSNKILLIDQLNKMDRYLRKIIEENEYAFRECKDTPDLILASKLPIITEYTDPLLSKNMFNQVFVPFRTALDEINKSYEKHISAKMV